MTKAGSLAVYTGSHFAVDFACGYLLNAAYASGLFGASAAAGAFLAYNTLAFGLQALFGALWDGRDPRGPGTAGCVLLFPALLLAGKSFPAMVVLAGLGNALFHVAGGMDSLLHAGGKQWRSGVFVSSGALGISAGCLAGKLKAVPSPVVMAAVLVCAAAVLLLGRPSEGKDALPYAGKRGLVTAPWPAVGLCLVSIAVRSWAGFLLVLDWKTGVFLTLLPAAAALTGKLAGGFAADALGGRTVGVSALLVSLPLLVFGSGVPVLCALGLAVFNMTMPVTLCAVAGRLPGQAGFAFGLTTFALLVGYLLSLTAPLPAGAVRPVLAAAILLSAACLLFAVPGGRAET